MEAGKNFGLKGEEEKVKKSTICRKQSSKCGSLDWKSVKDAKLKNKPSMIPVIKYGKVEPKQKSIPQRQSRSFSKLHSSKPNQPKQNSDGTLKHLEEEKSLAEYYLKIDDIIQKFVDRKEAREKDKKDKHKTQQNPTARKMISDPLVFGKPHSTQDTLLEFQNTVQQISDIWLKTAADLSNTIKTLKNNPRLDQSEFEVENMRIQFAINQAKSLTLLKTRNIITEARKLFKNRELLRVELENYLSDENLKVELESNNQKNEDGQQKTENGTGDFFKGEKNEENVKEIDDSVGAQPEGNKVRDEIKKDGESANENSTVQKLEKYTQFCESTACPKTDEWEQEMEKKNDTITALNKKIFDLQKQNHERSLQCTQLKVKIAEFHDKIQWNQVLWKQIRKLKQQIKGLQQSNKQLELQKKDLELKITKLDQELDRLLKLNHLLNQKKYLLEAKQYNDQNKVAEELKSGGDERIFSEKQNAISQLKTILNVMRDQESFAKKQILLFQSKIEELERNTKG